MPKAPPILPHKSTSAPLTPVAFVQAIVQAYRQRGMDPSAALEQAQIAPEILHDPAQRISAVQMERISDAAMRELDDEALGWFSRRLPWGSYGMLVRASISAPSLGVALKRWCRHHGLLTDDVQLVLQSDGEIASLQLHERRDLGSLREFCLVSVARNFHGVACWLIDSRIPLQSAQFPFTAPSHHDIYPVLFTQALRFDAAPASIQFDARYLDLPLRRDEAALKQMLQHALPLTVLQYRRDRLLVQRVRQILNSSPTQAHTADTLAEQLAMSSRTLHRQLQDEGASLQGLKDEVRQARAQTLLLRSSRPIKQVAALAGFQNEKSFIRAFRGWSGMSPLEFRRHSASHLPQVADNSSGNCAM